MSLEAQVHLPLMLQTTFICGLPDISWLFLVSKIDDYEILAREETK